MNICILIYIKILIINKTNNIANMNKITEDKLLAVVDRQFTIIETQSAQIDEAMKLFVEILSMFKQDYE